MFRSMDVRTRPLLNGHPMESGQNVPFSGRRLQQLRGERGLSRQQLARHAGLSRAYIYMLEDDESGGDGARRPSYEVVLKLARALDVEPSALFEPQLSMLPTLEVPKALHEAAQRFSIP